jgi:hypothetical protein
VGFRGRTVPLQHSFVLEGQLNLVASVDRNDVFVLLVEQWLTIEAAAHPQPVKDSPRHDPPPDPHH